MGCIHYRDAEAVPGFASASKTSSFVTLCARAEAIEATLYGL
jgi:hypothetical protein